MAVKVHEILSGHQLCSLVKMTSISGTISETACSPWSKPSMSQWCASKQSFLGLVISMLVSLGIAWLYKSPATRAEINTPVPLKASGVKLDFSTPFIRWSIHPVSLTSMEVLLVVIGSCFKSVLQLWISVAGPSVCFICSLQVILMALPICPTYTLLFSRGTQCIPQTSGPCLSLIGLSIWMGMWMVLMLYLVRSLLILFETVWYGITAVPAGLSFCVSDLCFGTWAHMTWLLYQLCMKGLLHFPTVHNCTSSTDVIQDIYYTYYKL